MCIPMEKARRDLNASDAVPLATSQFAEIDCSLGAQLSIKYKTPKLLDLAMICVGRMIGLSTISKYANFREKMFASIQCASTMS